MALVMQAMVQVGDKWRLADQRSAPLSFVDARSGHDLRLALVDVETGEPVVSPKVAVKPGPGADDAMRWRLSQGGHG